MIATRIALCALVAACSVGAGMMGGAGTVLAECGSYRPPPPPPSPTMDPSAGVPGLKPVTGGDPPPPEPGNGPVTTPGGTRGPTTGGGRPGGAGPGTGGGAATEAGHWTHWWYANRLFLMEDGARVHRHAARTGDADREPADSLWRAEARSALAAALADDDDEVVAAAVLALGKAGNAADIPLVRAVAIDERRGAAEREHATMALGLLASETPEEAAEARSALRAIAEDDDSSERLQALALYALGLRHDEAVVPFLVARARRPARSWDAPVAGLSALGLTGCEAAGVELRRVLEEARGTRQATRRSYAVHGLAKLGDGAALPLLIRTLDDDECEVRRAAALAVGAIAPPADEAAVRGLRRMLEKDDDRGARAMSAVGLGLVGGDEAVAALRKAYDRGDAMLRPYAAVALGVIARRAQNPRIVAPLLRDLRRGTRQELLGATCVAVGLAGLDEALPPLRELLAESRSPEVIAQAAVALGMIGDPGEGRERLRELLVGSHDPMVRGEVALALGLSGDVGALQTLEATARDGATEHARISGCIGLGRIGGPESARVLMEILQDERRSRLERHMAGNALGMLLDTSEGRRVGSIPADLNWYVLTPTVIDILTEM